MVLDLSLIPGLLFQIQPTVGCTILALPLERFLVDVIMCTDRRLPHALLLFFQLRFGIQKSAGEIIPGMNADSITCSWLDIKLLSRESCRRPFKSWQSWCGAVALLRQHRGLNVPDAASSPCREGQKVEPQETRCRKNQEPGHRSFLEESVRSVAGTGNVLASRRHFSEHQRCLCGVRPVAHLAS